MDVVEVMLNALGDQELTEAIAAWKKMRRLEIVFELNGRRVYFLRKKLIPMAEQKLAAR